MKFTPEEIKLCKAIAEKHRKEIKFGLWVLYKGQEQLVVDYFRHKTESTRLDLYGLTRYVFETEITPLWQIPDCLEWLYERYEEVGVESLLDYWEASAYLHRKVKDAEVIDAKGKTPLEACLKAVLAILES